MFFARSLGSLALVALFATAACSGAPDAPDAVAEALTPIAPIGAAADGDLDIASAHGGTGGTEQWIGCPTIVGLTGRTGNYIDVLSLQCEDVNSRWGVPSVGRGSGENPFNASCPDGMVVTGLQGRAHTFVDALGVICSNRSNWRRKAYSSVFGGGGGDWFHDECPEGQKISALKVRSATWLDRIEPYCSKI